MRNAPFWSVLVVSPICSHPLSVLKSGLRYQIETSPPSIAPLTAKPSTQNFWSVVSAGGVLVSGALVSGVFADASGASGVEDDEPPPPQAVSSRSEEHTSELQSRPHLVCRLLLEKKNRTP